MKARERFSPLCLIAAFTFSANTSAVIIEGGFTGNVVYAGDCVDVTATPVEHCTPLWADNIEGTVASGKFWYDTELAPQDSSPADDIGNYFTYSNTWINMNLTLGGRTFDISDSALPSQPPGDVEYILIADNDETALDGMEKQLFAMTDKATSRQENGDYISKSLHIALETWDQPIVNGTSLIQEYNWVGNGDLLQGSGFFNFESSIDQQIQIGSAYIRFTDFTMNIKNDISVPEPSSIPLLVLAALTLFVRRKYS